MYDVVVIGQGLSGMLSAIRAKEQGYRTALVAAGTGKIMQSTGVLDLIPGTDRNVKEWKELNRSELFGHLLNSSGALTRFMELTKRLGYPYRGDLENLTPIIMGSGHVKKTAFYPETISPIPERGML